MSADDRQSNASDVMASRGPEYERRCAYWESLTEDQVQGRAPLPEYAPLAAAREPRRAS